MAIQCHSISEIIRDTKKLLNNKKLQEEMIRNQEKYIKRNTCDKISNIVINEIKLEEKI